MREIIGYDNAGQTLEEIAALMHRDLEWVKQVLRACGRQTLGEIATQMDTAEADAKLEAALREALPGMSASAQAVILAKYAKLVAGKKKPLADLTPAEKIKIVEMLRSAVAYRAKTAVTKAAVTTAGETEEGAA
ncbi:MAG: hypothetical protein H7067_07565 [Burkholderiales bacterium]|nr:hypothetical protein [Opitutaceae bacterium]